jgi:HK97 family phage prohead protease
MIYKSAQKSIHDIDMSKRVAVTKFATYGTFDRDEDRANKGMFTKSWNEFKEVRFFLNHEKKQAPGKIQQLWDDDTHAYAKAWMGTHTLGEDVLKMMDEGIITDSSYGFDPIKAARIPGKGRDFKEVFHKEVSVLTHWGAHPGSKVISVEKEWENEVLELKQLNDPEKTFLRKIIAQNNANLQDMVAFAATLDETSDLYTWVNGTIADHSNSLRWMKDRLVWGQKEWDGADVSELKERLTTLKAFCRNTTASDDTIKMVLKEAEHIEGIISKYDSTITAAATKALQQVASGSDNDEDVQISLLNLQLMLHGD